MENTKYTRPDLAFLCLHTTLHIYLISFCFAGPLWEDKNARGKARFVGFLLILTLFRCADPNPIPIKPTSCRGNYQQEGS